MMTERWERFEPMPNLAPKYSLKSIIREPFVFTLIMSNSLKPSERLCIDFPARVFAYKKAALHHKEQSLLSLGQKHSDSFLEKWTFFQVKNSHYAEWVAKESLGIFKIELLMNFTFITEEAFLEIITSQPPVMYFSK
jgi:hypothetical protein